MFDFSNVQRSQDGRQITASCNLVADQAFFSGHFDVHPLMPAAAQLQMIDSLMNCFANWDSEIEGGSNIKFMQQLVPDEVIDIHLVYTHNRVRFQLLKQDGSLASQGELTLRKSING